MLKSILEMEMTRVVVWGDRSKEDRRWNYYLGDKLRLVVEVKDDLPTGAFTFFYKEGVPAIKGFFERGDRAGNSEYFLPTGEVLDEEMEKTIREHFVSPAEKISTFAISTFDTDYVLIRSADWSRAQLSLQKSGFTFTP